MAHAPTESDPQWYKDALIYELHVKAFFDSTQDGIGDFAGLAQKLDYLQELGITCIWLLPFYPSPLRDDGYDISDYHGVHPAYGTLRDFKNFVREAHRRGMRVVTELVINHTSDQHPWFQAARRAPRGSSKRNFYVWSDTPEKYRDARIIFTDTEKSNWTWDPVANAYYWHRFFHHQPDLNFDNPLVRRAVLKTMEYWLDMGVDGLRLDAVPYLIERDGTNCENLPETHAVLKELRSQLDAHYSDRMLLAEANQWPDDVRPYFGNGDQCHMAFHFPLMPRMFMALRQEDRHPITEIMRRTPDIPETCQWALFLRNHDELTLEMVTSEERDYMYKEYAADPQARLNLGIRRRLAPLLNFSRRRIELMNSLLFSFPGTPVIYYGDEIGMGDNIYLGDRNGVRTPMQWTGDRNGGFSRADFARLYIPPNMDPVHGYQVINVEAQQRDPSSLLNWMKRLIALRKQHKTFGRGTIEFLTSKNRKVLSYLRRNQDDVILAVANLSRFVQPVELDLSEFAGMTPIEMFGRTEFPPAGEQPYFLTLGPHSFYWFQLQWSAEALDIRLEPSARTDAAALPVLTLRGGWKTLLEDQSRRFIEREVLPTYLRRQRWFAGKARSLKSTRIIDATAPGDVTRRSVLFLLEIRYADGGRETYFLPLGITIGPDAEQLLQSAPKSILARLSGPKGEAVLHDALADNEVCTALLRAIEEGREFPTGLGAVRGVPTEFFTDARGPADSPLTVRLGAVEQSNSSVFFGNRLILKVFRRLEPGLNPDLELGRFLNRAGFERVPMTAGSIEYRRPKGEPLTLAILQCLVRNQGTGWEHALGELSRYYDTVQLQPEIPAALEANGHSLLELAASEPPPEAVEAVGTYLQAAATLGTRTAEMHLALASDPDNPAFAPEPLMAADLEAIAESARTQVEKTLKVLRENLSRLPPNIRPPTQRVLDEVPALTRQLDQFAQSDVQATKIRCHGDYHLGQVLRVEGDFCILDFEGEPARTVAERRAKQSPLKDLVGMLRSFDYAANAGLFAFTSQRPEEFTRLAPWARVWQQWASAAFLKSYLTAAAGASFLPPDPRQFAALLQALTLDKALYELLYELNNREDWIRIPLQGILALIDSAHEAAPTRSSPQEGQTP